MGMGRKEEFTSLSPTIEYYSGSQVTVFIDDVWIDDAASFQVNIMQNKQAIYGYGSQFYDFVARGKVLVSGNLTINYKDPNYLWIILANKEARLRQAELDKRENLRLTGKITEASQLPGGDTPGRSPQVAESLVRRLTGAQREDEQFKSISELFEEEFWGRPEKTPILDPEPSSLNHSPFNLHFLYKGDTIGVIEELSDVELLGRAKIVEANGQPIQEVYNFIARKYR